MEGEKQYATTVIADMIQDMNYFRRIIDGSMCVSPEQLYNSIRDNNELFKLLMDNIFKKTVIGDIFTIYNDIYNILIPWFKEILAIDNIDFIVNDTLEDDHTLKIKIYIENTYYGDFNPINGVYALPNINHIRELEKKAIELADKSKKVDDEVLAAAQKVDNPKKFVKKNINYFFNKKGIMTNLRKDFASKYVSKLAVDKEIQELSDEYEEYQAEFMTNRYFDDKLNTRLTERLHVEVDNQFIFDNDEEDEEESIAINDDLTS